MWASGGLWEHEMGENQLANSEQPVAMNVSVCARGEYGRRSALLLICTMLICGCGGEPRAAPVDLAVARVTLEQVMEHWKSGGKIDDLRSRKPEVVVQEALWSDGRKLLDYSLVGEGRPEDANWFCEVELTLESDGGNEPIKKKITYVVGTDPVLTVFRAIL
jgi:hypothetical protein